MIKFISTWTQGIIVAVIIVTIIEMLLPKNGNGKYVKVVAGIFVLFSIISPIVSKFKTNKQIDFGSYIEKQSNKTIETSNIKMDNQVAIKRMYEENLKIDIKSKLNQKGYVTGDIKLEVLNNNEFTLNKIQLKIISKNINNNEQNNKNKTTTIIENIENIKISLGGSGKDEKKEEPSIINESEKIKLRQYLCGVYEVREENIIIS